MFFRKAATIPHPADALPGRAAPLATAQTHVLTHRALKDGYPAKSERVLFGLGCFWGAERKFWQMESAPYLTAVGYAGGFTPNPTYDEVCSGKTGHNEVVLVVYEPETCSFAHLLSVFWESHDPTQGMRQGNDHGTQYRSGIYVFSAAQKQTAEASRAAYSDLLAKRGLGPITTEIRSADAFYFAEGYHQQYLAKNPNGYCGLGGTGVSCPIGLGVSA